MTLIGWLMANRESLRATIRKQPVWISWCWSVLLLLAKSEGLSTSEQRHLLGCPEGPHMHLAMWHQCQAALLFSVSWIAEQEDYLWILVPHWSQSWQQTPSTLSLFFPGTLSLHYIFLTLVSADVNPLGKRKPSNSHRLGLQKRKNDLFNKQYL